MLPQTRWLTTGLRVWVVVLTLLAAVHAYVPALPTNGTNIQGGPNVTDVSKLHLQWFPNGSYGETVSYQLVGADSNGFTQGAIVHFSEVNLTRETTTTPWIALVSCDSNATNASQESDIFTLAHDRGAVSALLYSKYSQACIINPAYADPAFFDQVMDIFSTQSLTSASLIEYQFGQIGTQNEPVYGYFNASRLNSSAGTINATIQTGAPVASGYLFASLQAFNATAGPNVSSTSTSGNGSGSGGGGDGGGKNTSLAMIILYAITGCVSALFCVVIISGAIRAIRHPERYGPRRYVDGANGGAGQSRARGLTRAILDTFPVVKFGQVTSEGAGATPGQDVKDVEAQTEGLREGIRGGAMEMGEWEVVEGAESHKVEENESAAASSSTPSSSPPPIAVQLRIAPEAGPSSPTKGTSGEEVVPEAIGNETCPICIVDFEEGDDLRVLPCEGKHKFHQQCVDPWLLELSSSCPICRQDFHALETMMAGEPESDSPNPSPNTHVGQGPARESVGRFSRYLRIARGRRHREREREGYDPTDPYMPTVGHEAGA